MLRKFFDGLEQESLRFRSSACLLEHRKTLLFVEAIELYFFATFLCFWLIQLFEQSLQLFL